MSRREVLAATAALPLFSRGASAASPSGEFPKDFLFGASTFGYSCRFGITYIDYSTQRRIPKDSFHWCRKVVQTRLLT